MTTKPTDENPKAGNLPASSADAFPIAESALHILMKCPVGVVVIGMDRRIRWANEYVCRLAGMKDWQTMQGPHCAAYLCKADQATCPVIDDGQRVKNSVRIVRRKDGQEIPILKTVVTSELNGETVLIETFVDLTESNQSPDALKNQSLFISSLLNAAPTPIFYKNVESVYLDCNEAFSDFLGMPRSVVIGGTTAQVIPGQVGEIEHDNDLDLVTRGGTSTYATDMITARGLRSVVLHKAVVADHLGEPAGVVGVITDVTAQKQTEAAHQASASLLDSVLESTTDGILVVDHHGGLTKWNRQFLELWGIPDEIARQGTDEALLSHVLDQLKAPEDFLKLVNGLYAHPGQISDDLIELADGRFFERYSIRSGLVMKSLGGYGGFAMLPKKGLPSAPFWKERPGCAALPNLPRTPSS